MVAAIVVALVTGVDYVARALRLRRAARRAAPRPSTRAATGTAGCGASIGAGMRPGCVTALTVRCERTRRSAPRRSTCRYR